MSDVQAATMNTAFDRSDLLPHWAPTLVGDERAEKLAAWQGHRACADCKYWEVEEGETVGVCASFRLGSLMVPPDHSCTDWTAA